MKIGSVKAGACDVRLNPAQRRGAGAQPDLRRRGIYAKWKRQAHSNNVFAVMNYADVGQIKMMVSEVCYVRLKTAT